MSLSTTSSWTNIWKQPSQHLCTGQWLKIALLQMNLEFCKVDRVFSSDFLNFSQRPPVKIIQESCDPRLTICSVTQELWWKQGEFYFPTRSCKTRTSRKWFVFDTTFIKSSQGRKENIFPAIQISGWVNRTVVGIRQGKTRFNSNRI